MNEHENELTDSILFPPPLFLHTRKVLIVAKRLSMKIVHVAGTCFILLTRWRPLKSKNLNFPHCVTMNADKD
jgi:hypothetical protein